MFDRQALAPSGKIFDQSGCVVLLGGGHAHVEVVRRLGNLKLAAKVILVSPSRHAPYSGMLPGYIAGRYAFEDFHIDLQALCQRAGAEFRGGMAVGIDPQSQRVRLADGCCLDYSLLSLDIGSTPNLPPGVSGGVSVKPIASFTERLGKLDAMADNRDGPLRIAVVGQGVAGVEIAFALQKRLNTRSSEDTNAKSAVEVCLVGRSPLLMPERSAVARGMVASALSKSEIVYHPDFDVVAVEHGTLISRDSRKLQVDEVVWTTSSGAPAWLPQTGLALDPSGFVRVDKELRSLSHPTVFAAGDVAALSEPRPKAGVFAVRAGPVLAENIRRALCGDTLLAFKPQRAWLALISLPEGRAIADKWGIAVSGRWVSLWKHWNDSGFVRRYYARQCDDDHPWPQPLANSKGQ